MNSTDSTVAIKEETEATAVAPEAISSAVVETPSRGMLGSLISRLAETLLGRPNPTVLSYHSVSDGSTALSVSTEEFAAQMGYLARKKYSVLNLQQYVAIREGRRRAARNSVLITFDDGYKDVHDNALLILKRHGFPAVVSVNPEYVGRKAAFATAGLDKARQIAGVSELQELSRGGVTVVNHGWSHKEFPSLSDKEMLREFHAARKWIENHIEENRAADVLVFPKGSRDARSEAALSGTGAKLVFGRRADVYPGRSMRYFAATLNPAFRWVRENKRFIFVVCALLAVKILLGILLLHNVPNVGLSKDSFFPTGGDDYSYVASARAILSGRWFSDINIIGYPVFVAALSRLSGIPAILPGIARPLILANVLVFSTLSALCCMLIVRRFWKSEAYAAFAGIVSLAVPYLWYVPMKNFTLVTTSGAIDHIGMSRALQLFGLTVGTDWFGAFLAMAGLSAFVYKKYGLAGFLIGLSFLMRAQNVMFLILLSLMLILFRKAKPFFLFGIGGFFGGLLQLLHNFMLTGSPLIFAAYSPAYNLSMEQNGASIMNILKLPLLVAEKTHGLLFAAILLGTAGAGFLAFSALKYFWESKDIFWFLFICGIIVPISLFSTDPTIRNPRYFLPFLPVFAIFLIANYEVYFLKEKSYP
jgi:peptidoglycan/xylan/chitin deacetylase (PgdA/CDA1 family)